MGQIAITSPGGLSRQGPTARQRLAVAKPEFGRVVPFVQHIRPWGSLALPICNLSLFSHVDR